MRWYHLVAYFLGGAFLVNAVPHFVQGVSGTPFPSPFATPPGVGLSSPVLNVAWGSVNLALAWLLLARVGTFQLRRGLHALVAGLGGVAMAVFIAQHFERVAGRR